MYPSTSVVHVFVFSQNWNILSMRPVLMILLRDLMDCESTTTLWPPTSFASPRPLFPSLRPPITCKADGFPPSLPTPSCPLSPCFHHPLISFSFPPQGHSQTRPPIISSLLLATGSLLLGPDNGSEPIRCRAVTIYARPTESCYN